MKTPIIPMCGTCICFADEDSKTGNGKCHFGPKLREVHKDHWCRQHSDFEDYLDDLVCFKQWLERNASNRQAALEGGPITCPRDGIECSLDDDGICVEADDECEADGCEWAGERTE